MTIYVYIRVFYDWYQDVARGQLERAKQNKSSSETDYWIFQIVQLPVTGIRHVGQTNRHDLHNFRNFLS